MSPKPSSKPAAAPFVKLGQKNAIILFALVAYLISDAGAGRSSGGVYFPSLLEIAVLYVLVITPVILVVINFIVIWHFVHSSVRRLSISSWIGLSFMVLEIVATVSAAFIFMS